MIKQTDSKAKRWLNGNVKKYRPSIIFLTALTVLSTICSIGFAYLSNFLINSATEKNVNGIILFSVIVLSLLIGRIVLRAIIGFCSEKQRATIATDLRAELFKKVLKSDYSQISNYHSGDIITRITADSSEIAGTTVGLLPEIVGIIIQVVGVIFALVFIDAWFTLFLLLGGIIVVAISAFLRKKTKWYYKEIMSADGKSRSFMQESVQSSLTIKAFGVEDKISNKANVILENYKSKRVSRAKLNSLVGVLYSCITNLGLIFAIVWCAFGIIKGMPYGAVVSIVLLMEQLQRPLNTVSAIMPAYYSRIASAERLYEIYEFNEEDCGEQLQIVTHDQIKKIIVKNAYFSYGREDVFSDLSLEIEMDKFTCLYGVSGGGKSTLFKLLLGVYSLSSGEIGFETDSGFVSVNHSHRNIFAFVPQGNFLFAGTVYENLTLFSNEKDKKSLNDKVKKAIEVSCAEFVYELPNGLETVLTEQGGGLSEGQKQRLAIARALLSDRSIILMDESTSALDSETEKRVINNLMSEKDKTYIMVSHRDAVIKSAYKSIKI